MDSTAEAENLAIDQKLLAQPEDLESQYNPNFDLGFDEGLASQYTSVQEHLNSPSAKDSSTSVKEEIQPPPKN